MRKLTNVRYVHTNNLTEEQKDELLVPEEYSGVIAIETWNVNDKELRTRAICVPSVVDYIRGFGEFKDVPIEEGQNENQ